jgi:hypothetical protein
MGLMDGSGSGGVWFRWEALINETLIKVWTIRAKTRCTWLNLAANL